MFCKKCGNRIPDGAKFCPKCGNMIKTVEREEKDAKQYNLPEINIPKLSEMKLPKLPELNLPKPSLKISGGNIRWPVVIGAGAAAVLLAVLVVGIRSHNAGKVVEAEVSAIGETVSEPTSDVPVEEQEISDDEIVASSAITLEGNYKNLKSVIMEEAADGSVQAITYQEDASFPALESLQCGAVMKQYSSGERVYFDEADFPVLKSVRMKLVNRYIDEDTAMTYLLFDDMYKSGKLQSFDVELIHTIEDLYGTWSDKNQTFSFTFNRDGTLRVSGSNNLFGADVMKFTEVDDDTLSLSADTSGLLGMVSVNMDYVIFGDNLEVDFAGQQFTLTRKE